MNCTLMPVCSNLLPSLGLTVTAPFTDSPSIYNGTFSLLFLSCRTSTMARSSPSSRTMSMSTGVEKKYDIMLGSPEHSTEEHQQCVEMGMSCYAVVVAPSLDMRPSLGPARLHVIPESGSQVCALRISSQLVEVSAFCSANVHLRPLRLVVQHFHKDSQDVQLIHLKIVVLSRAHNAFNDPCTPCRLQQGTNAYDVLAVL